MTVGLSLPLLPSALSFRRNSNGLHDIEEHVKSRMGAIPLSGRYHKWPRQLEDDYEVTGTVLGTGYSGAVLLATHKGKPNQKFALKALALSSIDRAKMEQLKNEVEVFLCMDHPHITRLHDVYESKHHLHLVMECMEGGELFDRIEKKGRFDEVEAADAVWQMLLALNYLHVHGMVHRDVKPENFLFDQLGSNHLKLIDFGFSKMVEPNIHMHSSLGTAAYVAPEVLKHDYTSQCDLWSLGVVSFILLSGHMPFAGDEATMACHIENGKYTMKPQHWHGVSAEAKLFTQNLLDVNPNRRLTARTAMEHVWLAKRRAAADSQEVDAGVAKALHDFSSLPRFHRCCLEMMAWSLSSEERAQVQEYFISMDRTHQGTISLEMLTEALKTLRISDEEVRRDFELLDTNHDHEIHYSEFLAAMLSTKIAVNEELICDVFKRFDMDGSGFITASDLRLSIGETFEGERVERLLLDMGFDKDEGISYEEFVEYLRGHTLAPDHTPLPNNRSPRSLASLKRSPSTRSLKVALHGLRSAFCMGPQS